MSCASFCSSCDTKNNRGFMLVRYGGNFDNNSYDMFHIQQSATVSVKPGDLLFTPLVGSQYITVTTATGNYGVRGTDFLYGTALECSNNSKVDHNHFEFQRIRDGHQYRIEMKDKTMTQAALNAYIGTRTLAHYDNPTKKWSIDNTLADSAANVFQVMGGNAADGYVLVEIVQ